MDDKKKALSWFLADSFIPDSPVCFLTLISMLQYYQNIN